MGTTVLQFEKMNEKVLEMDGGNGCLWLCGSQETVENSERDRNTRPPDLPPEVRKQQLELNMEQQTGSK